MTAKIVWLVSACIMLIGGGYSGTAYGAQCPPSMRGLDTTVSLDMRIAEPRFDFGKSKDDLARLKNDSLLHEGRHIAGLTVHEKLRRVDAKAAVVKVGSHWCAYPAEVTVLYHLPAVTVYVAREYPRGTCQFNSTMRHEMQHVNITNAVYTQAKARLQTLLGNRVRSMRPAAGLTKTGAVDRLVSDITEIMKQATDPVESEFERRQAAIDTPASYRELGRECRR